MKRWTLPATALVAAVLGAGIAVSVMALWEPWDEGQSELVVEDSGGEPQQSAAETNDSYIDRLAACGRSNTNDLDDCNFFADLHVPRGSATSNTQMLTPHGTNAGQ